MYNSDKILLRIFDEIDVNHDQRISKHEFKLYKKALLEQENRSTFEDKLGSTFAIFDRNQDNFISRHEIRETMKNLGEFIDENLIDEMMKTADIDHDGRISRDEFEKLLHDLHSKK